MKYLTVRMLVLVLLVAVGCTAAGAEGKILSTSSAKGQCGQPAVQKVVQCGGDAGCGEKAQCGTARDADAKCRSACDKVAQCASACGDAGQCATACADDAKCATACADDTKCATACVDMAQCKSACGGEVERRIVVKRLADCDGGQCGNACDAVAKCGSACEKIAQCCGACGDAGKCSSTCGDPAHCKSACGGDAKPRIVVKRSADCGGGQFGSPAGCDGPRAIQVLSVFDCGCCMLVILDIDGKICVLQPRQINRMGGSCGPAAGCGQSCGEAAGGPCKTGPCGDADEPPCDEKPKKVIRRLIRI